LITSTGNPRVKEIRKLARARERKAVGLTLLEGPHLAEAAVAAGAGITEVWVEEGDREGAGLAARAGLVPTIVSSEVLRAIATTENPRGPVATMSVPSLVPVSGVDTVVLWNIGDPGNAGTLIRSAAAFGWQVAMGPDSIDVWAPKVLRAGAGAHFSVRIAGIADLDELRAAGLTVIAGAARGGHDPATVDRRPIALLIGSEPHGLPEAIVATVDEVVTIETAGSVESLNAAVAGSILMWSLRPPG